MKNKINKNTWFIIKIVVVISVLIPLLITFYQLITTDKESVVFLENYHPTFALIVLIYYAILMALIGVWLIKILIKQFAFVVQLKNEKKKVELLHLKSQVNPHFFFNVLNNLYGLVGRDVEQAQDLILKLSDIMRYSIYEGQKDFVTISEEVAYLNNYIDINQMRYHKKIDIHLNSKVEENNRVMPLLFIILLENAFKHGVEKLRSNAFVHINIKSIEDKIEFTIENNFDKTDKEVEVGIGLTNLRRRLELVYPNKHSLVVSENDNIYKAQLSLLPI